MILLKCISTVFSLHWFEVSRQTRGATTSALLTEAQGKDIAASSILRLLFRELVSAVLLATHRYALRRHGEWRTFTESEESQQRPIQGHTRDLEDENRCSSSMSNPRPFRVKGNCLSWVKALCHLPRRLRYTEALTCRF